MLDNHIENIRNKPEHVKRNVALLVAGGITLVIVVIWVFTLGGRFSGGPIGDRKSAEPFSIIKNTFGEILHRTKPSDQQGLVNGAVDITPGN